MIKMLVSEKAVNHFLCSLVWQKKKQVQTPQIQISVSASVFVENYHETLKNIKRYFLFPPPLADTEQNHSDRK